MAHKVIAWRDRPFVSVSEAAALLSVSRATLYRMRSDRKLDFVKIGGRSLIRVASLASLVDGAESWTPEAEAGRGSE